MEIGRCEYVPLPCSVDMEDFMENLDAAYNNNEDTLEFQEIFCDAYSDENNKEAIEKLEKGISAAIKAFISDAGIESTWFKVIEGYTVVIDKNA